MRPLAALHLSLGVAVCIATMAGADAGGCVTPADFGARGDGIADDTAALQAALDSGRPVFVPRGDYRVRMNQLSLPDGTHLSGEGTLSRIFSTEASEAQEALLRAVGRRGITVEGLAFETPLSTQGALLFASCSEVNVSRCHARNCQLVYVGSSAVAKVHDINNLNAFFDVYDHVTEPEHYCRNITIRDNTCVGDGVRGRGGVSLSGIFVSFARNVRIAGNDLTGYLHGITWWGGNANTQGPVPNGDITNPRKVRNLTITGNTVHAVEMGGIWGAMGENVTVSGNSVEDCGDVGIDFEGCLNCTASGNSVQDCYAACLCTVFDNRGIVFSGNACAQHTDGWWIAAVRNTHASGGNQDVSFVGNHFSAHNGRSVVVSEGVRHLLFQGNTLSNVALAFRDPGRLHQVVLVSGNDLVFDAPGGAFEAVRVGPVAAGGHALLQGNSVLATTPPAAGSTALDIRAADPVAERYRVSGNLVSGWGERSLVAEPADLVPALD